MFKKLKDWLKLGLGLKRWTVFGLLGIGLTIFGIIELLRFRFYSFDYKLYYIFLIASGIVTFYVAINEGIKNFIKLVRDGMVVVNLDSREIGSLISEHKLKVNGPKIVALGGGTGLSTMLRGIKNYTTNITAVVTVGDDGGGSGRLRNDMGILPPGDIRNCLVSLANTDRLMEDLMQYRFSEGELEGQSFGNLFIAAMTGLSENFETAVSKMSEVLSITGKVLPVTTQDLKLLAELKDGSIVKGESSIGIKVNEDNPIVKMSIDPPDAKSIKEVTDAIKDAEAIILGPGSLFTSVMPNLLIKDVAKAIKESSAIKIYVCNIMTQPGETDCFSASDHLKQIYKHANIGKIDYIIVNNRKLSQETIDMYGEKGAKEVKVDYPMLSKMRTNIVKEDVFSINKKGKIRHDTYKLSRVIMDLILKAQATKNANATDFILFSQWKKLRDDLLAQEIKNTKNLSTLDEQLKVDGAEEKQTNTQDLN